MIEKENSVKKSKNIKRLKAALDDKYRIKILNLYTRIPWSLICNIIRYNRLLNPIHWPGIVMN